MLYRHPKSAPRRWPPAWRGPLVPNRSTPSFSIHGQSYSYFMLLARGNPPNALAASVALGELGWQQPPSWYVGFSHSRLSRVLTNWVQVSTTLSEDRRAFQMQLYCRQHLHQCQHSQGSPRKCGPNFDILASVATARTGLAPPPSPSGPCA